VNDGRLGRVIISLFFWRLIGTPLPAGSGLIA
jgi:hypothetical protein